MNTLDYIKNKFNIKEEQSPIKLNISRFGQLPELFKELGFKTGAEVGVSKGRYSRALCEKIPDLKLYCVDPWKSYDEYVELHDEAGQILLDSFLEITKERLAPYNFEIVRKTSMKAVKDFEDSSLDFCFLDGNHTFEYIVNDIAEWSKKVKVGGIISGHDYWNSGKDVGWLSYEATEKEQMKLCQVKWAVDAYTNANKIAPWFITGRDKCPSFFWVKE
jgi:hypothetical protein